MFSATLSAEVIGLAADFTRDPVRVDVSDGHVVAATVTHRVHPAPPGRKRGSADARPDAGRRLARRWSSARPSADRIASATISSSPASRLRSSTATRARVRARARSATSRPAACRCWWPRISRRAASTSRSCRWSSTTTCRSWRRTTSIGWAGPDAPGVPAAQSRWCRRSRADAVARHPATAACAARAGGRRGFRDGCGPCAVAPAVARSIATAPVQAITPHSLIASEARLTPSREGRPGSASLASVSFCPLRGAPSVMA